MAPRQTSLFPSANADDRNQELLELLGQCRLRLMLKSDVPAVMDIENAVFQDAWSASFFLDDLLPDSDVMPWVLLKDEVLLGYCIVHEQFDYCHLINVAVHPDWQGRGLGRYLVALAINHALRARLPMVALEVRVSNIKAQQVYRRFGFRVYSRLEEYYLDVPEDAYVMVLELHSRGARRTAKEHLMLFSKFLPDHP